MKVLKAEFKPQSIKYRGGYKYQLAERYGVYTRIRPEEKLIQPFIILRPSGHLSIGPGYAWDGPSGPTFDTPNFMRGSLIHDALYQLMRNGLLREDFREDADKEIKKACLEDGMTRFRAAYAYWSLRRFAGFAADEKNVKEVLVAP